MTTQKITSSATRFVAPAVLLVVGLATAKSTVVLSNVSHEILTLGFAAFAVGVVSLVTIYNHARNPVVGEDDVARIAQGLVVYAGVLTVLVYEQVFTVDTMLIAASLVLVFGTLVGGIYQLADAS